VQSWPRKVELLCAGRTEPNGKDNLCVKLHGVLGSRLYDDDDDDVDVFCRLLPKRRRHMNSRSVALSALSLSFLASCYKSHYLCKSSLNVEL